MWYLVIIILGGAAGIKAKVQTASSRNVHSLLELVVVAHRVHGLYGLPGSPWGRYLQPGEETWLFTFIENSTIKEPGLQIKNVGNGVYSQQFMVSAQLLQS